MQDFSELYSKVVDTTTEIFSTMVMMNVAVDGQAVNQLGTLKKSITGMVGLAGICKGVIAIHLPDRVAMAITASFLGMEIKEINEDVQDAVGEIANMLGGSIKTVFSENGKDIQLSLPSTISGDEYVFQPGENVERIIIPFHVPDGVFHVELEIERQAAG